MRLAILYAAVMICITLEGISGVRVEAPWYVNVFTMGVACWAMHCDIKDYKK